MSGYCRQESLAVRLVFVGAEGAVNLGFIARLAKNFGVSELYLVSPRVNPEDPEAVRFAAKASELLKSAKVVSSLDEALKGVDLSVCTSARVGQRTDVLRHPITPKELAELALKFNSVAIVLGRESVGLTREEIAKCDLMLTIPANPEYPVLNVSHAAAIILYELWCACMRRKLVEEADAEQLRRITLLAEELVRHVIEEQRVQQVLAAIKHCIFKARLSRGEASALYLFFKRLKAKVLSA